MNKSLLPFILCSALVTFQSCGPDDSSDVSSDYDKSIVIDDLTSPYNRYRLWYRADGAYLFVMSEEFSDGTADIVYLTGQLTLDVDELNAKRLNLSSVDGDDCVQVLVYDEDPGSHVKQLLVCNEARNSAEFLQVIEYFDFAFGNGRPKEGPSTTSWSNNNWSSPKSKLTYPVD